MFKKLKQIIAENIHFGKPEPDIKPIIPKSFPEEIINSWTTHIGKELEKNHIVDLNLVHIPNELSYLSKDQIGTLTQVVIQDDLIDAKLIGSLLIH